MHLSSSDILKHGACRIRGEAMGKKPYRVEVNYPRGKESYYLVKDIKVRGKKRKIRKYLGRIPPSAKDVEKYRALYAYAIELKAAEKRAELSSSFYESKYLAPAQIKTIETVRFVYKAFTDLLTTNEIDVYERDFEVTYVQGTTSIEGNTLSLKQAYDLLVNDLAPNDKSLREINEVQNFKKVKAHRDRSRGKVTIDFIKTLHSLIMSNIDIQSAGVFRRVDNVGISGCDLQVTPSALIEPELTEITSEYYTRIAEGWHPFEEAVMFHYKFEMIHPFTDGNGRVGREIFNYMLTRIGYPKLLFLGSDRTTYIKSLKMGNDEKYADMIEVFSDLITKQRLDILKENLKKVVVPPKKTGQLRITDYFTRSSRSNERVASR
jgi:Fic family protein